LFSEFWMNIIASILASLITAYLTSKLKNWWTIRKYKKLTKKKSKLINEYKQVKFYLENRNQYKEFLLIEIIKLIGQFAITAIIVILILFGLFSISGIESIYLNMLAEFLKLLFFVIPSCFLFLIFDKVSKLEILHLRLKDFTAFENMVKEIVSEDELRDILR